ncbi:ABC transporter substrate-binding protein [Bacteriovorax sp. DB6_IX]|uniref:substrate-binding periplasmic protein n=1 Tax=Bacteriovorax sp. DB6_IX TaxID=1353530 RepID=UPI00038A0092|nr:transporter substrate-binding domain-containing protein [Bacteriovorax sp. DB6_IX]EQC51931.1 ABC transporter, substrate-binding protein, family 3 [Bacteriovorax sp. DB6_IX]
MRAKIFVLILLSQFSLAQKIELLTIEWAPYVSKELKNNGFLAQIVKEAFHAVGHEVVFHFVPWSRAVKMAEDESYNGFFPEYYDEKRLTKFSFSHGIFSGPAGLYYNSNENVSPKGDYLKLINGKRVGLVRGYINTKGIDEGQGFVKDYARDDLNNLRKLQAKRVDYIFIDDLVAQYYISRHPKLKGLKFLRPAIEMKDLYICFSKSRSDSIKLRQDFNRGLKLIKKRIPEILKLHGVKI